MPTNARYDVIETFDTGIRKVVYKGIETTGYRRQDPDVALQEGVIDRCVYYGGNLIKYLDSNGEVTIRYANSMKFAPRSAWEDCKGVRETVYRTSVFDGETTRKDEEGNTMKEPTNVRIRAWLVTEEEHDTDIVFNEWERVRRVVKNQVPFARRMEPEASETNHEIDKDEVRDRDRPLGEVHNRVHLNGYLYTITPRGRWKQLSSP